MDPAAAEQSSASSEAEDESSSIDAQGCRPNSNRTCSEEHGGAQAALLVFPLRPWDEGCGHFSRQPAADSNRRHPPKEISSEPLNNGTMATLTQQAPLLRAHLDRDTEEVWEIESERSRPELIVCGRAIRRRRHLKGVCVALPWARRATPRGAACQCRCRCGQGVSPVAVQMRKERGTLEEV